MSKTDKPIDFIIDYETLSARPDCVILDVAVIPFVNDFQNLPTFNELIESGLNIKLKISSQRAIGRSVCSSTLDFWKKQDNAAKVILKPTPHDVELYESHDKIKEFLYERGVMYNKSQGWCRGFFDFPIFADVMSKQFETTHSQPHEIIAQGKMREIRTVIEAHLGVRGKTVCPLPKGTLPNFIHHNSLHDCAKDVLMLLYAQRYAYGIEDVPSYEDAEPVTAVAY